MKLWKKLVSLAVGTGDGVLIYFLWKTFIVPLGHVDGTPGSTSEGLTLAVIIGILSWLMCLVCFMKSSGSTSGGGDDFPYGAF